MQQSRLQGGVFTDLAVDPTNARRVYVIGETGVLRINLFTGIWEVISQDGPRGGLALVVSPLGAVYASAENGSWRYTPPDVAVPIERPRTAWGALIYLNGDNDLDGVMVRVFDRLESVATNTAVCINVLWDRVNGPTREYLVQPDAVAGDVAPTYVLNQTLWDYGELDMGARSTFEAYLARARIRCPADNYFVAVVDHGGGWAPQAEPDLATRGVYKIGSGGGLSWDDTSGGNRMGTSDVQLALENTARGSRPIDVLFYDACLMGTFEDVYAARRGARYLVASPNIAWGVFPYDRYIQSLTSSTTPREFAQKIAATYAASLPGEPYTVATYDLARADAAADAMRSLGEALRAQLPSGGTKITDLFTDVQKYDTNNDDKLTEGDTVVDAIDLATRLERAFPGTPVATAAVALREKLISGPQPLIISKFRQSSTPDDEAQYDHQGANGLSVYFPIQVADMRRYPKYVDSDSQIEFAVDTDWGATLMSIRSALPALAPDSPIDPPRYRPALFGRTIYLPLVTK